MLISLKTLIEELEEDKELKPLLSSFSCAQNQDIEFFLHNRAMEFERLSKSRTYLIFDQDEMMSKNLSDLIQIESGRKLMDSVRKFEVFRLLTFLVI